MHARPRLRLVEGGGGRPRYRDAWEFVAVGVGLVLTMALAARLPAWRTSLGTFQGLYVVGFAFQALALLARPRWKALPHAGIAVFAVALAARVAVLPVSPTLSDDVYRYVWEGRVIANGENPYRHAPDDPALASLRDEAIHPHINHRQLRTIYPPLAQAGFALVAVVRDSVPAMKLWILLHDLALVALLALWAHRRTGTALPAIAYAWCPLPIVEYAGTAHHDPTALVWMVAAFLLAERQPWWSALALVTGVLVKLFPLLALPFLWRVWPTRVRLVAAVLLGAGLAWFALVMRGADSGLFAYAASWRNNEGAFALVADRIGERPARFAAGLAVLVAVGLGLARSRDPADGARLATRVALLAGPVLHPWYLGWALVFEPLGPSAAWLLLGATSTLAYGVFAPPPEAGGFHLPWGWRVVEYGAPAALAIGMAVARRLRRKG